MQTQGVTGIQNVGNTCYAAATLQLLRACTEWDYYCMKDAKTSVPPSTSSQRILAAYQDINRSLWSAYTPAYVRPLGFFHEIREAVRGTVYDSFAQPIPQDAHEFLVYLLDQFHQARMISKTPEQSPLMDLFFGTTRKTVTCGHCRHITHREEIFNVLSVPCKGATFAEWMAGTSVEEAIEGFACDACHGRHPAVIRTVLHTLPPNLFVALQRFEPSGSKNMVACPYDGMPFMINGIPYEVRGVIDHHGSHRGGHYTAQWKHPFSQEWWWFDDEKARALQMPTFGASTYVMLLKRTVA